MVKAKISEHKHKHGIGIIILGILVLLNAVYMPVNWPTFIGIILILAGIKVLIIKHNCC